MADTGDGEEGAGPSKQTWTLKQEEELRLEVSKDEPVTVHLKSGTCEIYGSEIAVGMKVKISGQKFAVFTWHGAEVELEGTPESAYKASETPMQTYMNVHGVLEERRQAAQAASGAQQQAEAAGGSGAGGSEAAAPTEEELSAGEGPRVLLVGPTDSGKSTLTRILTNYATRRQWAPLLVDLDVGQNGVTPPGTISAVPVEAPIDMIEGVPPETPLAYWFGAVSPEQNPEYYRLCVERLAGTVEQRGQGSPAARAAGMFINTMGWVDGLGYKLLLHAQKTLRADVILVLGHERLHAQLESEFATSPHVEVVKLARSGGVVTRPPETRKASREAKIKEYFEGQSGEFTPSSSTVPFKELNVVRVGGGYRPPSSALPAGVEATTDPMKITPVSPSMELMGALLAVSHAEDINEILSSNVAGFVHVTEVDMKKQTVTYTAPCPGPLPGKYLVIGSVTWFSV